jgi:hypothetical protein
MAPTRYSTTEEDIALNSRARSIRVDRSEKSICYVSSTWKTRSNSPPSHSFMSRRHHSSLQLILPQVLLFPCHLFTVNCLIETRVCTPIPYPEVSIFSLPSYHDRHHASTLYSVASLTATDLARNRYPALMSVFGVVGGTYLTFVLLSPNKDGSVISDADRRNVRGGSDGTSPFGTKTARSPRSTAGTDYEKKG